MDILYDTRLRPIARVTLAILQDLAVRENDGIVRLTLADLGKIIGLHVHTVNAVTHELAAEGLLEITRASHSNTYRLVRPAVGVSG